MNDARETILATVSPLTNRPNMLTDAIIEALPHIIRGVVKPLVWVAEDGNETCEDAQGTGMFYRVLRRIDDMGLLRINGSRNGESVYLSVEGAKQAAQDHHVAQLLSGLGIGGDA